MVRHGPDRGSALAVGLIGGDRQQYFQYFKRPDVRPLWQFLPSNQIKACCAFKAVLKKNGRDLRKILATLEANYLFGPALRTCNLGLWGGASLTSVVLLE